MRQVDLIPSGDEAPACFPAKYQPYPKAKPFEEPRGANDPLTHHPGVSTVLGAAFLDPPERAVVGRKNPSAN
jgi:hypothetical protein